MARPVTLFTGQWADLPVEEMARMTAEFGYDGIELACWGDHFEVDRAIAEDDYCDETTETLGRCRPAVPRHQRPSGRPSRAGHHRRATQGDFAAPMSGATAIHAASTSGPAEELMNTARAAQKFGVDVVNGFTGSSIWHLLYSFPPVPPKMIDAGFELLAERFNPILDVFGECGVRFALEVHPTEIAFDIYTAQRALEALDHRPEFGFNFDPSHLIWQGVDPVQFIRAFPDRIYHVHIKDAIVKLDGRSGILASHLELW